MKNIPQASTRIAYWVGADLVSARNFRDWIYPTRLICRTGVSPVSVIPMKLVLVKTGNGNPSFSLRAYQRQAQQSLSRNSI